MPLIKQTTTDRGLPASFHIIDYVEIFRLGSRLGWRAHYRSYASAEAYRFQAENVLGKGTLHGVPYQPGEDPINAFEQAAATFEGGEMFGAEVVESLEPATRLEILKVDQWTRVKHARDAYLSAGVSTPYGVFDSDLTSIVNLLGASATVGSEPVTWILADNSVTTLTATQLQEVGAALAAFRSAVYARGAELRAQIDAAEDEVTLRQLTWSPPT